MRTANTNFDGAKSTCRPDNAPQEATGRETVFSRRKEEIVKEAGRIEESSRYSSGGHFAAAALWQGLRLWLGLPATVLASIAAASAFSQFDAHHSVGGWISVIVAVLTALTTFLNPNSKAGAHFVAGNSYCALRDKARIFRTIDCWGNDPDEALAKRLKNLAEEKSELNRKNPQIPWLGCLIAKRVIAADEAAYEQA